MRSACGVTSSNRSVGMPSVASPVAAAVAAAALWVPSVTVLVPALPALP